MTLDLPSLLVGAVLAGLGSWAVGRLIRRRGEYRDDVRALVVTLQEVGAGACDHLDGLEEQTAMDQKEWAVLERNLRQRVALGCRRLPRALRDPSFQSRAVTLTMYVGFPGMLHTRLEDAEDDVLWINEETQSLVSYLEAWLSGRRRPNLSPEPAYASPRR